MKWTRWMVFVLLVLMVGCGSESAAPASSNQTQPQPAAQPNAESPAAAQPNPEQAQRLPTQRYDNDRKILKEATFVCEVDNVVLAMSSIGTIANDLGGYVLETRAGATNNVVPNGFVKIAVPADTYESALQKIRAQARSVLSEQATGTDVSQEYVDTQSQITNLEATQQRLRQFLEQAQNVDESLQVNAKLSELEGQISQLKGRINYLDQRSSFSLISVDLRLPPLPEQPAPPPPPMVESSWTLKGVWRNAVTVFQVILKTLIAVFIWLVVVVLPYVIPLMIVRQLWRRYQQHRLAKQYSSKNQPPSGSN